MTAGRGFESHSVRMPLDKAFWSTIVSLDPGVVNGYPAGIYSLANAYERYRQLG